VTLLAPLPVLRTASALPESQVSPPRPFATRFPAGDVEVAYAIQQANTDYWLGAGRRLLGRKIGLTAKAVQKQLGVDEPDFGMLFADMALADGEEIQLSRVMQPKVEAEVALVLERDLTAADCSVSEVIRATAYVLPAIEIVGSRIRNGTSSWSTRSPTTHRRACSYSARNRDPCMDSTCDWPGCAWNGAGNKSPSAPERPASATLSMPQYGSRAKWWRWVSPQRGRRDHDGRARSHGPCLARRRDRRRHRRAGLRSRGIWSIESMDSLAIPSRAIRFAGTVLLTRRGHKVLAARQ